MAINKGQARRIAAEWQAPGNECSKLQHTGVIGEYLLDELNMNIRTCAPTEEGDAALVELQALRRWVVAHGPGKVEGWGAWSDKKVTK